MTIAALLCSLLSLSGGVEPGDVPSYTFERPVFNGMGVSDLEDLRGKPVLIQFWGRKAAAVDDAMREVLAWQAAYPDDLSVLLVEVKRATDLQVVSLALKKEWLGGQAMWTTEAPCRVGLAGALPQFVLLSSEGVVLLKGTTESMELGYRDELVDRILEQLNEQVERRREGPQGLASELRQAYEAFAAGRVGKALELARGSDAELARGTLEVLRARVDRRLERVAWQLEHGYLLEAEAELGALEGELAGEPAEARALELAEALREGSLEAEWKAAKALAKLERKLYADGPKSVLVKQLARLPEKHAGTATAERAAYLLEAARTPAYE